MTISNPPNRFKKFLWFWYYVKPWDENHHLKRFYVSYRRKYRRMFINVPYRWYIWIEFKSIYDPIA